MQKHRIDPKTERRQSLRVPLEQAAVVSVLERGGTRESFPARTLDMSSNGILLECDRELRRGQRVEVAVCWPAKLDGKSQLKLVVLGRIKRCDGNQAAVSIEKKEFRTAGRTFAPSAPPAIASPKD